MLLSPSTTKRVIDIFLNIANYESKANKIRHALILLPEFDASALFHRVDHERKGYIDEDNIIAFLKFIILFFKIYLLEFIQFLKLKKKLWVL